MTRRAQLLVGLAVPTGVALAFLAPFVAAIGFLSDDFVLANLLDATGTHANWAEIRAQFGERWLYSQAYWRPIVNVVYGLNATLLGTSAAAFGVVNLAMHVGVVLATAWLCLHTRGPRTPVVGAVVGASLVSLHPATVETVLWISARVTGVEVLFRMLALCAFQAHLHRPSRGRYAAVVVLAALALASKESAVVLPVAFVLLDLLDGTGRSVRDRLRTHLPLVPLWIGYFVLRVVLLGGLVGSPLPEPTLAQLTSIVTAKLALLFTPAGSATGLVWLVVAWATLGAVVAGGRAFVGRALVLLVWILVCFAPTYKAPLGAGYIGARMLYDALPIVALALAHCVATRPGRRGAVLGIGAGLLIAAVWWPPARAYARDFEDAWAQNATAARELAELGDAATDARPLVLLSAPPCRGVPGPINPVSYHVLGRAPFAARPFPVLGLGAVLDRFPFSAPLFQDPRPLHALGAAGMPLARWDEMRGHVLRWLPRAAEVLPADAAGATLRFTATLAPWELGALEVETDATVEAGSVVWLTDRGRFDGALGLPFAGGIVDGATRRFAIEPVRHAPLLALAMAGGRLQGVEIAVTDGAVRTVHARATAAPLATTPPLAGRAVRFAELGATLVAPPLPASTATPMRCVIASEATCYAFDVVPDRPITIPDDVAFHLRMFTYALRATRCHVWFETTAPQGAPGTARSAVDWFVLTDVPR